MILSIPRHAPPHSQSRAPRGLPSYRDVLAQALDQRMRADRRCSRASFARAIGVQPSQLTAILKGRKGLSPEAAERVAEALGFDGALRRRFRDLVASEHARNRVEREEALRRLQRDTTPVDGTWRVIARAVSSGSLLSEWDPRLHSELLFLEEGRFSLAHTRAPDKSVCVWGSFELIGGALFTYADRFEYFGEGSEILHRFPMRHHLQVVRDDELLVRTPAATLPAGLCPPGADLHTTLRKLRPAGAGPWPPDSSGSGEGS